MKLIRSLRDETNNSIVFLSAYRNRAEANAFARESFKDRAIWLWLRLMLSNDVQTCRYTLRSHLLLGKFSPQINVSTSNAWWIGFHQKRFALVSATFVATLATSILRNRWRQPTVSQQTINFSLLWIVSGLFGSLHGLFKLLSAVYGAAHWTISKPPKFQSNSKSVVVVIVKTKHNSFHWAGNEALHSEGLCESTVTGAGEGASFANLHLHDSISIGFMPAIYLWAEVSFDGSSCNRERLSTIRNRLGSKQSAEIRWLWDHAWYSRLRSAWRRLLNLKHSGNKTLSSVETKRERRLRHSKHWVHQGRNNLRRELQVNYGFALSRDGKGEAVVRESPRQHQSRDSKKLWPDARSRGRLGNQQWRPIVDLVDYRDLAIESAVEGKLKAKAFLSFY